MDRKVRGSILISPDSVHHRSRHHARQLSLGVRQPESHLHRAQHRDGRRRFNLRLVLSSHTPVEFAEANMTTGLERSHFQLLGQRLRIALTDFGEPARQQISLAQG